MSSNLEIESSDPEEKVSSTHVGELAVKVRTDVIKNCRLESKWSNSIAFNPEPAFNHLRRNVIDEDKASFEIINCIKSIVRIIACFNHNCKWTSGHWFSNLNAHMKNILLN
jgi:hypothetical protein